MNVALSIKKSHAFDASSHRRGKGFRLFLVWLALVTASLASGPALADQNTAEPRTKPNQQSENRCTMNALERSRCIIDAILKDVSETYDQVGGGGISMIKQEATNSFTVSISQEERIDLITYEVEVSTSGEVTIANRTTGTKTFGD